MISDLGRSEDLKITDLGPKKSDNSKNVWSWSVMARAGLCWSVIIRHFLTLFEISELSVTLVP